MSNVTIVREVLQYRCSEFFERNMYIGDIICQKCTKEFKRIKKNWVRVFRPLAIPASSTYPYTTDVAVNTERCLVERSVNDDSFETSRKIPLHMQIPLFPLCLLENYVQYLLQRVQWFAYHSTFSM